MKKRYFFITLIVIIIASILVWACKHPTGTGSIPEIAKGGGSEDGGVEVVKNYLSQEEQNEEYDYEDILFTGTAGQIPALTVTAREVIIAASGTSVGSVTIKRSSDMGMTWLDSDFTPDSGYTYPFFINCHNGDILLGVTTATTSANSQTIFYRSSDDGETWSKQDSSSVGLDTVKKTNAATDGSATYGQGITLRHGGNLGSQKLMFPYFYNAPDKNKSGCYVAIVSSEDDGRNFNSVCESFTVSGSGEQTNKNIGSFGSHISKILELANGDILLNMRCTTDGWMFWMLSTNCGKNWDVKTVNSSPENQIQSGNKKVGVYGKYADFIRYEFNGKDIKLGGDKYALMITSYKKKSGYEVMLTDNDFNHGKPEGGTASKYKYTKEIIAGSTGGYPAITVLPDGTIATLTEDNGDMYFKRFNLYWLTGGAESINYNTDTSVKF